ncbi:SusC/RagA family TonB-linked outer membrane protein [Zunongwangia sp. HRR-M8]|uniref:SusC/RagA family TonB-linked outer membrane protein n=1 Tax=Zunongwangia sp. HRR-M8 TaxID=3015170 RepID=UPI0022DD1745|nr:SusC/RagA family TonB-linked outer membrane protein [Zunongwangia sp. HRR-M8]WBL21874.1 SusC/RagA family TonB-linked outer membrane protein [Zunongwangia sp. HRR-M8]
MNKKITILFAFLFTLISQLSFAIQQEMISGTVKDSDGLPLPGVNVMIKDSNDGVQTDFDGNYSIEATEGDILVFSFVGLKTLEYTVANVSTIDVTLQEDASQLSEVVVTALGIKRNKKSLGFAQQSITGENVIQAKDTDISSALAGKVAGVQLVGSPSSSFNNALIRLRGETDVLFVVDGIKINDPSDINVEDIADISVLKGIAGTALYGTEARNGAVIITTKSAKNGQMKITIDEAFSFSNLYLLPEYQNEYGGGYSQTFSELNGEKIPNYAADESWGPALDGTLVRHWDSWIEGSDTFGELRAWSPNPDNVRDFYETGTTNNITATLLKGGEDYSIKATINNLNTELIYPNSEREQSTISLKTSYNLTDKLSFNGNFNYQYRKTFNNPVQGYGSIASNFNQWWQRQLDIDRLKNYRQNGQIYSWNLKSANDPSPLYWNSPYFDVYENTNHETKNAVYGSIGLDYDFNDEIKAMVDLRRTSTVFNYDDRNAWYGLELPFYREYTSQRGFTELYTQINYEKTFGDFDVVATGGGQWFQRTYKYINAESVGGLQISNFYSIDTSVDNPNYTRDTEDIKNYAGFITASVGYDDILFLDGSYRKEWGSTASVEDNSVDVYGISGSFIFSELLDNDFVTFGKLRAGFAQAPSFPQIYQLNQTYTIGNPYNGSSGAKVSTYTPNQLPNQNLKGGVREEQELGLEFRFLESRLGLDFTYYHREDKELPTQVTLNGASGYSATYGNEAFNKTNGWELGFTATPIKSQDLTWDLIFNIAGYKKTVEKVSSTSTSNEIASAWGGYVLNKEGEDYGNIYGYRWLRGDNGEYVYNSAGVRQYTNNIEKIGNIQPDFTGGMINNIYYKNFSLNFSIDFQKGGDFYSVSRRFNAGSGIGDMTVGNNNLNNKIRSGLVNSNGETPLDIDGNPRTYIIADEAGESSGGVYVEGVDSETGEPVSYYIDAHSYFGNLTSAPEEWIYDASYVKLRQLKLGYTFPKSTLENLPFNEVYLGAYANNLWLIYSDIDGIDPSELESYQDDSDLDLRWQEGGQSPSQRTFGMNLKISF